ncbi:MAG: HlyD family efflux transporter periplasmic adaptor subunit [Hydrococcus sp. Prado102]|jgi:HlyD family secretion protein|nr:HlyD family efflux transporter periplasmic adaptor subunit [Hydrococcus sp. Prado102]
MNFSNGQPPNANNRQKKRVLVVDGQTKGSQNQKPRPWSKIEDVAQTVDGNKRSRAEKKGSSARYPIGLRKVIWTVVGLATLSIVWTLFTQIEIQAERTIVVKGHLTTRSNVKEMQIPENKVVKAVFVKEGEKVNKGQPLVEFDAIVSYEKLQSLENQRQSLVAQNQFYRFSLEKNVSMTRVEGAILQLKLSRESAFLVRNRASLLAANQQLEARLLENSTASVENDQNTTIREDNSQDDSQKTLANIAVAQLQEQLAQYQTQLEESQDRLMTAQKKLGKIEPLVKVGAIARAQYTEQQQVVRSQKAELKRLRSERERLQLMLDRATEQLVEPPAQVRNDSPKPTIDFQKQIADNKKQITEIDSQLTKIIVENDRQIADLDRQIDRLKGNSNSFILKAPVAGTVSQVMASPGFGVGSDRTKTLLKLNSDDRHLLVDVLIPKEDLDSIQAGMKADLSIDALSLNRLGNLHGTVILVGSDALPPDAIHHFYGIPAKISLDKQSLALDDKDIPLRSGMPATASITVSQKKSFWQAMWQKFLGADNLTSN